MLAKWTQPLAHSSTAVPRPLTGSCIGSRVARTWPNAQIGYWHHSWSHHATVLVPFSSESSCQLAIPLYAHGWDIWPAVDGLGCTSESYIHECHLQGHRLHDVVHFVKNDINITLNSDILQEPFETWSPLSDTLNGVNHPTYSCHLRHRKERYSKECQYWAVSFWEHWIPKSHPSGLFEDYLYRR